MWSPTSSSRCRWPPPSAAATSAELASGTSGVGLRGRAVELVADDGLVAGDPVVRAGVDDVGVARTGVALGAVLVDHVDGARDDHAHVVGLAVVGAGDGLDALRPLPAGLERDPGRLDAVEVDDRDRRLVGRADLVGRVEALDGHSCHWVPSLAQLRVAKVNLGHLAEQVAAIGEIASIPGGAAGGGVGWGVLGGLGMIAPAPAGGPQSIDYPCHETTDPPQGVPDFS